MRSNALAIALALACTFCSAACLDGIPPDTITPQTRGGVEGRVLDKCTGRGLANASVSAGGVQVTSGADGSYRIVNLKPGSENVSVSLQGYLSNQPQVDVPEGNTLSLDIRLAPNATSGLPSKLDVLFVVDNSGSMGQEQLALANAFGEFLSTVGAVFGDVRIGVISTTLGAGDFALPSCSKVGGDQGKLQNAPRTAGCTAPSDPWISIVNGKATNTGASDASDAFSCIARLGVDGCGFEQTLEAVHRALDPTLDTNPGFLRKDAMLAVIVLSDEDDCSASDDGLFSPARTGLNDPLGPLTSFRCFEFGITCDGNNRDSGNKLNCKPRADGRYLHATKRYVDSLVALKGTSERVFFAVVAGPTSAVSVGRDGNNPVLRASCTSNTGVAVPALRLNAVAKALNPNLAQKPIYSICTPQLPMTAVAQQLVTAAASLACK